MRETQFGLLRIKEWLKINQDIFIKRRTGLSRGDAQIGPLGAHASAGRRNASRSKQKLK